MEKNKKCAFLTVAAALASATALAQVASFETNDMQRANLAAVADWPGATERGLKLDKASGEVVVLAEFCGIDPNATVEFPIIGELSDRAYEALFRTFAKPSSIGKALEALGLPRGKNVDSASMDFWPYGERVTVDIAPFAATNGLWKPIQSYIVDMATRAPLAYESFVYCGSRDAQDFAKGARLCDAEAPNSVFSTYNEPQTLIDMPALCSQGDVYERFLLSPENDLVPFGLYKLRFRPDRNADGSLRRRIYDIRIEICKDAVSNTICYATRSGCVAEVYNTAAALTAEIKSLVEKGFDVFTSISFGDSLTIAEATAQAKFISQIEGEKGIRVRGPNQRDLYYKGFLPSESWRVRENRPSQPWEIRFLRGDGRAVSIELVKTIEDWTSTDSLDPILSTEQYAATTPEEALKTVADHGDGLPVLLVFAPKGMTLGEIMPTLRLLKEKHPTVYVFGE